ncbi:MAG: GGDEF domain-containing protein [Clostridiales bacterium]|nr:GGDEF domain-containing protein [Clostridiales bacterium]
MIKKNTYSSLLMKEKKLLKTILIQNLNYILIFCMIFTLFVSVGLLLDANNESFISHATILIAVYFVIVILGILIQRFRYNKLIYYILLLMLFYFSTLSSMYVYMLKCQASFEFIFIGILLLLCMSSFILIPPFIHVLILGLIDLTAYYLIASRSESALFYIIIGISTISALVHNYSRIIAQIDKSVSNKIIKDMHEIIEHTTIKDVLTNLYNNKYVHQQLEIEIIRSLRYDAPLSLLIVDIDHFSKINDKYGQVIGDDVLSRIGNILLTISRTSDILGRFSGKTFIAILPNTILNDCIILAERLRITILNNDFGLEEKITVSIGLKQFDGESQKDLVDLCLQNVGSAKSTGRNKIFFE